MSTSIDALAKSEADHDCSMVQTALVMALDKQDKQDLAVVKKLLELKANPNQAGRSSSNELVMPFAFEFFNPLWNGAPVAEFSRVAKLLHQYKADVDASLYPAYLTTPLMAASEACRVDLVQILLGLNADTTVQNPDKQTAMDLACQDGGTDADIEKLRSVLGNVTGRK